MSTYMPKSNNVERKWYIIDAAGNPLGRTAVKVANLLRGKNKSTWNFCKLMGCNLQTDVKYDNLTVFDVISDTNTDMDTLIALKSSLDELTSEEKEIINLKPEEVLTMYGKKRVIDDLDAKK